MSCGQSLRSMHPPTTLGILLSTASAIAAITIDRHTQVYSCTCTYIYITLKMNEYKQSFFCYLSYIFVTQVTLKWVVFTYSLLHAGTAPGKNPSLQACMPINVILSVVVSKFIILTQSAITLLPRTHARRK